MISKKPLFSWITGRNRGYQVVLLGLILATIFLRVFPLEIQKRIVNSAIALRDLHALLLYCAFYLCAVVLAGVLKYAINVLQGFIGQKILLEMRSELYRHILSLPLPFFRHTPPGMVIASLTSELSAIGEFAGGAIAVPVINILSLAAFAAYMAYLNPILAILSFAVYPLEIMIVPILQKRFNALNRERIDVTRSLSNVIGEAVSGIHEVQGNAAYELEHDRLDRFGWALFKVRHRMNLYRFLIKFTNNFFQSLGPFILFLVGGYLTIQGRFDLGALVAFLSAYEKLYDPWKELMDYYQNLQDSTVRYRQIMEAFDQKPEVQLRPDTPRAPFVLTGDIEIKDLSLTVNGQLRLLDQVSFRLNRGEHMALVGSSGSGKSSLAMVIGQLYGYSSGHILVNGMELKTLTRLEVSRNIGYIPQFPFIFDGTIRENLLYGCRALATLGGNEPQQCADSKGILRLLEQIGFSDDILIMGLNALLARDRHQELARRLIPLRRMFSLRWSSELADLVDFFDIHHFQHYTSIAENIVFGHPLQPAYSLDRLPTNPRFRAFLKANDLLEPLRKLGEEIASRTVSLLKDVGTDAFFFEMSPIAPEEFEEYSAYVERLASGGGRRPPRVVEDAMIKLALRFVPALHKMASLPSRLEEQLLMARRSFQAQMSTEDPTAFDFYQEEEYLFAHSVLENILFGHLKLENPRVNEQIVERVKSLLNEAQLLDAVREVGLEFQVGSKGDRLSGGQRQKIAIARALLKTPPILIMDEATASLDNASQALVHRFLKTQLRGQSTVIAVVHRLEMVQDFDLIAVMKAGTIVEMGKYEELIQRKGPFYELATGSPERL